MGAGAAGSRGRVLRPPGAVAPRARRGGRADVDTWLLPHPPWHLRVHRLRTGRRLLSAEGAFAVDRDPAAYRDAAGPGHARVGSPAGLCVIEDLTGARTGELVRPLPGTNVMVPRTVIPTLRGEHVPGGEGAGSGSSGRSFRPGTPSGPAVPATCHGRVDACGDPSSPKRC
ncbi:hypothetical protein ACLQ2R_38100 [Streptosporangium sp. DT93]|uniref:DUF2264 C-terminal domain-containing protein n=1 Tax=Streptosporangium sp. DT93 TaxID=3393428 RepID=UPI003CF1B09B